MQETETKNQSKFLPLFDMEQLEEWFPEVEDIFFVPDWGYEGWNITMLLLDVVAAVRSQALKLLELMISALLDNKQSKSALTVTGGNNMCLFDKFFKNYDKDIPKQYENTIQKKDENVLDPKQGKNEVLTNNDRKKHIETCSTGPGLSQWVTFGRNRDGEVADVFLNNTEKNIHKTIINHSGRFENFPGIVKGRWTNEIEGNFDFDAGTVFYRTSFTPHNGGLRCLWTIQPDGRYWADDDGFGADNDSEIILYADLDSEGNFITPFKIYTVNGRKPHYVDESPEVLLSDCIETFDAKHTLTAEEKTELLVRKCTEILANDLSTSFAIEEWAGISFQYYKEVEAYNAENVTLVTLEVIKERHDLELRVYVSRKGTDFYYVNFLTKAGKTRESIRAWLLNVDVCIPIIMKCAERLSRSIDEHWENDQEGNK